MSDTAPRLSKEAARYQRANGSSSSPSEVSTSSLAAEGRTVTTRKTSGTVRLRYAPQEPPRSEGADSTS